MTAPLNPAVRDAEMFQWLSMPPESWDARVDLGSRSDPAPNDDVISWANSVWSEAESWERDSVLLLDNPFYLENPFGAFESSTHPSQTAWFLWGEQMSISEAARRVFEGALSGSLRHFDFLDPDATIPDALVELVGAAPIHEDTRLLMATGQNASWTVPDGTREHQTVRNWFLNPRGLGNRPAFGPFDSWIGVFPTYFEAPENAQSGDLDRCFVELPLSKGFALFLAKGVEAEEDISALLERRERLELTFVELQVPRFEATWSDNYSTEYGYGDVSALIPNPEAAIVATSESLRYDFENGQLHGTSTARCEIKLEPVEPPNAELGASLYSLGQVSIGGPTIVSYASVPADCFFNEPFRWVLLDPAGTAIATSYLLDPKGFEEKTPDGWLQSLWFGNTWRAPKIQRHSFFFWSAVGAESEDTTPESPYGWQYHAEHRWIFTDQVRAAGFWYFDNQIHSWCWSSAKVFPAIYDQNNGWLYYTGATQDGSRYFYSFSGQEWRIVSGESGS